MSELFWLTNEQMERLRPFFPKSHDRARVDDCPNWSTQWRRCPSWQGDNQQVFITETMVSWYSAFLPCVHWTKAGKNMTAIRKFPDLLPGFTWRDIEVNDVRIRTAILWRQQYGSRLNWSFLWKPPISTLSFFLYQMPAKFLFFLAYGACLLNWKMDNQISVFIYFHDL